MGIQQVAPVVQNSYCLSVAMRKGAQKRSRTCGCRLQNRHDLGKCIHIYIYYGNRHCGLNGHCIVCNCWHLDSEPCPTVSRGFAGKTTFFGIQILHFPLQDPIIVAIFPYFSQIIAHPIYIGSYRIEFSAS